MNIKLKRIVSSELIRSQKIKFDLQMGNLYKRALLPCLVGVIIIIINLNAKDAFLGKALGANLIFLSAFSFYSFYSARRSFVNKTKKIVEKCEINRSEIRIEINEGSFIYETFETKFEYKWSAFSNYKLSKGILYLLINDNYLTSIGIDENELTKQELVGFYTFLIKTVPEKK